ncbi:uncharacterized protein LOC128237101 [Mya arenaria]|uniref:uncharacterized protein LOC128237101 n=1 Tax=Mya arenaria TaxID=6604 RepID=UPI0022E8A65B|nr:uncharacterized protein LOC128237101 [Mya arenaria]XP_052808278.1 uncharacterized protein LOC128237101 [Mya arenaria]
MAKLKKPARRKRKQKTTSARQLPRLIAIQRRCIPRVHRKTMKAAFGESNLFWNKKDAGAKEELDTAPNSYLETSFLLSTELENMGYNDVNRKKKQEIMIALDECVHMAERAKPNGNPRFNLAVGSQIECTALKDSDYDVLFGPSAEHVAAISTSNEMKDGRVNALIVKNKMSPPGHSWIKYLAPTLPITVKRYTMLKLEMWYRVQIQYKLYGQHYEFSKEVPDEDTHWLRTWPGTLFIDDNDLKFYVPNSLFTLIGKQMWAGKASRTGPSFSCNTVDVVRPIFCDTVYPKDQDPIIIGGKLYGSLHVPKEYPCNFVPVGHHESENAILEWRISYNLTEREIMFGFNITHIQTYVVLKMLQRHYFKRHEVIMENSFTSFHCKTALFHAVASTEAGFWVKRNLINCVRQCLKMIRIFAKKRFCPHFFNKAFNIFSGKLPRCGKHWGILIELADDLIKDPNAYFKGLKEEKKNTFQIQSLPRETQTFVLKCTMLVEQVNKYILFLFFYHPQGGHAINVKLNDIRQMRVKYKNMQRKAHYQMELSTSGQQKKCAEVVLSFLKVRHCLLSAAYLLQKGKKLNALVPENILPDALSMELQMSSLLFASGN